MKKIGTILRFELGNYFGSKSYLISTILLALLCVGIMFAPRIKESFTSGSPSSDKETDAKNESDQENESVYAYYDASGIMDEGLLAQVYPDVKLQKCKDAAVDVSGRTSDVTATCTPIFYDANGDEISGKKLESKVTGVSVTIPVYKTKTVAVKLDTTGVPADNYKVVNAEYVPNEITVGGPADVLQNLTEITVDDIDVSGCSEDLESTIEISKYLPDGVVLADENTSISVHVAIERNISRTMTISANDITIENKLTDYDYAVQFPEGNTVVISGLSDEVAKLTAKDLKITIDAETLSIGANTVELSIKDSDTYTVDSTCKVDIEVTAMP